MTTDKLPPERQSHSKTIGSPFGIILNPSGGLTVMAGQTGTLSLSLINEGGTAPLVNAFIDETSQPVRNWCRHPEQRLALGLGQSSEVLFDFEIPLDTIPGPYPYTLIIDAPDHYPEETPILFEEQLQVLPYVQEARLSSDPTFNIQPATLATAPMPLQQGQPLDLAVLVQNRSDRVDRFRLTCPDLEAEWYRIIYPESYSPGGVVTQEDSLELNPGDQGTIRLIITPPIGVRARVYTPTVYLKSINSPELMLLDVVYFQIVPIYLLTAELVPILSRITHQDGQYMLFLRNNGNTERKLQANLGQPLDESCDYRLYPEDAYILPGGSAALSLTIHPKHRWKRPFYGKTVEFALELADLEEHPIPSDRFAASVLWEGRPWWQFLLVLFSAIGLLGTLIFLIWLSLPRPPRAPEILQFYPQSYNYEEENDDVVRLNWQLNEPKNLANLQLQGISPEGLVTSRPIVYDFSTGLPEMLQDYCQLEDILICINVPTDARQAGDYIFELVANPVPKRRGGFLRRMLSRIWRTPYQAATTQTKTIRMAGLPIPEVVSFAASRASYNAAIPEPPEKKNGESADNADASTASTSRTEPPKDASAASATNPLKFQSPIFSLEPGSSGAPQVTTPPQPAATDTAQTQSGEAPESATNGNAEDDNEQTENGDATPEPPFTGILLNWELKNPQQMSTLQLVGRDAQETVVGPDITYDFSQGIPQELRDYCRIRARTLRCTNVPTAITQPGLYTFALTPIPQQTDLDPIEPTLTDPVKIVSAPILIKAFQINGVEALPKYVMQLSSQPILLTVSWEVISSEDVVVELLPSPGSVAATGAIPYPLSQEAGVEVITLQATNGSGETVSRTVTIEKFGPGETPGAAGEAAPGAAGEAPAAPGAPGDPPPPPTAPPSETAPPLPSPPDSSPPVPSDRNTPPPSELPPTLY
ncbi:MAG: hypothetical protein F6J87_13330 [Spirulina sp. SIO3F2]|nr:hypothetical protein [Spirulina sp. SIO3F2]